jgi:hypothetical protein
MVTSDRDEIGGLINIICDPRQLEQKAKDEVSDDEVKKSTLTITSIELYKINRRILQSRFHQGVYA